MDVFGSFSLLLAFVCAVYAFVGGHSRDQYAASAADQKRAAGRDRHLRA